MRSLFLAVLVALIATPGLAVSAIKTNAATSPAFQQIQRQLAPEKSWALLIGISDFDDASWPHLGGVQPELETMTKVLTDQGFSIAEDSHVGHMTHDQLAHAILHFFAIHGQEADARLVVYVATHGYADPGKTDGDGFLVASDSAAPAASAVTRGYSVNELKAALSTAASQHIFMFFDSCFSGAMLPGPDRAQSAAALVKALDPDTLGWTRDLLSLNARLVLTAGNADETVPDGDSPFAGAIASGLAGAADADSDGVILGSELAQYVRGQVARASRAMHHPNDPVFAIIEKTDAPLVPRADARPGTDYRQQGDFVFLNFAGPSLSAQQGIDEEQTLFNEKLSRLEQGEFLACLDCPTMLTLPGTGGTLAFSETEVTYAQWDACYRVMACQSYLSDNGFGRGDRPASGMTWLDALQYLAWLKSKGGADNPCITYRLPTALEWSYAALYRPTGTASWAEAVADGHPVCWGCGPGDDGVAAQRAASRPADAAGLYDMIGNLWEWVADGTGPDTAACGLEDITKTGNCGLGRVMGGSFATASTAMPDIGEGGKVPRTDNRRPWSSTTIGLRVACDVRP